MENTVTSATILVVEDEAAIQELVGVNLQQAGHAPIAASSAEQALSLLNSARPNLILLDWLLPGMSGIEFARRVKKNPLTRNIPIIMLTARSDLQDKISGLEAGADDYICKPFSPRELMARIKAVLRRHDLHMANDPVQTRDLHLDPATYHVTAAGQPIELWPTEFRLLHFLMAHPERVHSRAQLLKQVWGGHADIEERTVDVHIRRLRLALQPNGFDHMVQTVRSIGYRWAASLPDNAESVP
jgi:two-component system phosphate regulon response regulator PhoB